MAELSVESALRASVEAWLAPSCAASSLSFDGSTLIPAEPGDGVNTIEWVLDWQARGLPADAAATTDVQYIKKDSADWQIGEADIYLNARVSWSASVDLPADGADAPKDLQAVLTHELGHALGLLHPCEETATVDAPPCGKKFEGTAMFPIYSATQRTLSADDVSGLCYLYPASGCGEEGCPDGSICAGNVCAATCDGETCGVGEVCALGRCIAHDSCQLSSCVDESCSEDAECAFREFCSNKRCVRGPTPLGDPCGRSADCFDGACVDGACTASCLAAQDCPPHSDCDIDAHVCRDVLQAFGALCSSPTECRGDKCLMEDDLPAVCTRSCGSALAACPLDWTCRTAEGEQVCVPEHVSAEGGGGCAIRGAGHRANFPPAISLLGLSAALIFRTCRRVRWAQSRKR